MGQGQFEVGDDHVDELNRLDDDLVKAVEAGDEAAFGIRLAGLVERAHQLGTSIPDDYLGPSDCVLPGPDATLAEVQALLGDEGLIPG